MDEGATYVPLAVCLGFRDWHLEHLERCLLSLRTMQGPSNALDIILVDTGSERKTQDKVCKLGGVYRVFTCFIERPEWSRAWALNKASKYAGPHVSHLAFTDADMIFPPEWLPTVLSKLSPNAFWLTRTRDLSEGMTKGTTRVDRGLMPLNHWKLLPDTERGPFLRAITIPHPPIGQGGGMVVPKAWFRGVRGFDESYRVWGCEDNDLVARAQWDGLTVDWLPETFVAHQYHPRDWPTDEQWEKIRANRERWDKKREAQEEIEANSKLWAGAIMTEGVD